ARVDRARLEQAVAKGLAVVRSTGAGIGEIVELEEEILVHGWRAFGRGGLFCLRSHLNLSRPSSRAPFGLSSRRRQAEGSERTTLLAKERGVGENRAKLKASISLERVDHGG